MRHIIAIISIFILQACTSFDGRPTPVLSMSKLEAEVEKNYSPSTALKQFNAKSILSDKRAYRDEVIFSYMAAINGRYSNYLIGLSKQNKGTNVALETLILGLTAGVTVADQGTGQALAAGSTFLQGTQGSINSRLYYEQTLPALVNIMEAERSAIKSQILTKIKADDSPTQISYGMGEALMDVGEYESTVSIERAIAKLTQEAALQATEASENLKAAQNARNE